MKHAYLAVKLSLLMFFCSQFTSAQTVWHTIKNNGLYSQVQFLSNTDILEVRYLSSQSQKCGMDLCAMDANGIIGQCKGLVEWGDTVRYVFADLKYNNTHKKGNIYTLYFPVVLPGDSLQVGVSNGKFFEILPEQIEHPVIFCSTPSMNETHFLHPSQLTANRIQRSLEVPVVDLARLKNPLEILHAVKPSLVVADSSTNVLYPSILNNSKVIYLNSKNYDSLYDTIRQCVFPMIKSFLVQPCQQHRDASTYLWQGRHTAVLQYNRKYQPEIAMIGNSITHYWGGFPIECRAVAADIWNNLFEGYDVVNLGFGWDRLENIAWRLWHGELDDFVAKKVFMHIGTNNLHINTDDEIIQMIEQIVQLVQYKQPGATLYLVKILPRRGYESRISNLNTQLANKLSLLKGLKILDFADLFLSNNGTIQENLFSDGLHPNQAGYQLIAKRMKAYLIHD